MTLTTVPNRNMVLLAIALSLAIQLQADAVAFGAHGGAYTPYADCQPEFAAAMDQAAQHCHRPGLRVLAPFIDWDKADIVRRGAALGVPWSWTYSCYAGGPKHCGRCGTCQDRALAFRRAGIPDPTAYETDPVAGDVPPPEV
jgi:7-cyano-7-deazaguanine synthase